MKIPKISKSKRMWLTIGFALLFAAIGIYAISEGMITTANISIIGSIAIVGAYLGVESFKPSKIINNIT